MASTTQPLITDLRIEQHPTGLGIPHASPRISWRYGTSAEGKVLKNWVQVSYEIQVQRNGSDHQDGLSFSFNSRNNILVPWPDSPLASRERARIRVRASGGSCPRPSTDAEEALSDSRSTLTEWSDWINIEAALLDRQDWQAKFISSSRSTAMPEAGKETEYFHPIRLRKNFILDSRPRRAILYITALGVYEAYMNGRKVGGELMAPGWTSYNKRLQYQVFDVADLLRNTDNTIAIEVAEGWYAGRLLWDANGVTCFYGDRIGALAQLEIYTAADDLEPVLRICSDDSWGWCESAITSSSIYDGEHYDLGKETDWTNGNMMPPWESVTIIPFPTSKLLAMPCPPVRVTEVVKPVRIFESSSGKTLVDFGQNLVGRVLIKSLTRADGHILTIRHAEVLEHDGELGTRPLRSAKATDTVTFSGSKPLKDWAPHFTFHGFRCIEITGWSPADASDPLTLDSISAQVLHSDMPRTGYFESSNESLNRLHENVVWSTRSNFLSIPTDCPQRDERLGWTGDIQVFAPTASFLFDCAGMLSNWLHDVVIDQEASGGVVPFVVPDVITKAGPLPAVPQAVWDDVVVLVPWTIYLCSGDKGALETCWDGMRKYVDDVIPRDDDGLWDPQLWQLADWLDPAAPPDDPGAGRTDGTLVADAYLVHVTRVMYRIAKVLNEPDTVAEKYQEEAEKLVTAFRVKYMTPIGLVAGDSQTSLALALVFGLHDGSDHQGRATAVSRLVRLVRAAKFKVNTGFAGTPVVLPALTSLPALPTGSAVDDAPGAKFAFGQKDTALQTAYRLLLSTECPSILYPVTRGATTIWERWDSMLPDGRINPGEMTSFNHYALGSVAAWLHAVVGGLSPYATPTPSATGGKPAGELGLDESVVGWRRIRIRPQPGGDLTWCKTEFRGGCGVVKCSWELVVQEEDGDGGGTRFKMDVVIPPNTTAIVSLPESGRPDDDPGQELGSGEYHFECVFRDPGRWPPKAIESFNYQDYLDRNKR